MSNIKVGQVWKYQYRDRSETHEIFHLFITAIDDKYATFRHLDNWAQDDISMHNLNKFGQLVSG